MRKQASGAALITAATLLSIYSLPAQKEETAPVVSLVETENQGSELQKDEVFVLPTNQVPVTLVDTIDGDTIKVNVNNKIETVRYLLIDTPESKKPGVCVQPYAKDAYQLGLCGM